MTGLLSMTAGDTVTAQRFPWAAERNAGLICFPHPTQPARAFASLAELLSPSVAVVAIRCVTWANQPPAGRVDQVDHVERTVMPAVFDAVDDWVGCQLAVFGHQAGAWLAFEVARRLERVSRARLAGLFVSASPAPSRRWRGDAPIPSAPVPPMRDESVASALGGCGPQEQKTIRCPIMVLAGDADTRTTVGSACAWSEHTTGAFDIRIFPGDDHYFNAYQRDVANAVSDHLLSVRGEHDDP